jgi:hypothetical protein
MNPTQGILLEEGSIIYLSTNAFLKPKLLKETEPEDREIYIAAILGITLLKDDTIVDGCKVDPSIKTEISEYSLAELEPYYLKGEMPKKKLSLTFILRNLATKKTERYEMCSVDAMVELLIQANFLSANRDAGNSKTLNVLDLEETLKKDYVVMQVYRQKLNGREMLGVSLTGTEINKYHAEEHARQR